MLVNGNNDRHFVRTFPLLYTSNGSSHLPASCPAKLIWIFTLGSKRFPFTLIYFYCNFIYFYCNVIVFFFSHGTKSHQYGFPKKSPTQAPARHIFCCALARVHSMLQISRDYIRGPILANIVLPFRNTVPCIRN